MFFVFKSSLLAKANVCWDREQNSRPNSDTERWDGLKNANWLGIKKLPSQSGLIFTDAEHKHSAKLVSISSFGRLTSSGRALMKALSNDLFLVRDGRKGLSDSKGVDG